MIRGSRARRNRRRSTGIHESKVYDATQQLPAEHGKTRKEVGAKTGEASIPYSRRTIATLPSDEVGDAALLRKKQVKPNRGEPFSGCRYCHLAMSFADTVKGVPKGVKSPNE